MSAYLLAGFIILVVVYSAVKRVNCYDAFCSGARDGLKLTFGVFPCLVTIFIMLELMNASGVTKWLTGVLSPLARPLGIPDEISRLLVLRPLSGSGSLALTEEIISVLGADSYPARCASVIMGSSETVLYVCALYFSKSSAKKTGIAVPVSIACSFLSAVLACAVLRVI